MSGTTTTTEISRAALTFSLDRENAARLIRDLAAALAPDAPIPATS